MARQLIARSVAHGFREAEHASSGEAIGLLNAYVRYIPADVDIRLKT
jgi:hypothetical protein